jgi:hypothetical protein
MTTVIVTIPEANHRLFYRLRPFLEIKELEILFRVIIVKYLFVKATLDFSSDLLKVMDFLWSV